MISRKTLLRSVAGFFVSAKKLKERGFKFLTARPWAERGSRFTLDLFLFF